MNSLGRIFRVSLFGESHGRGVGVVIDGVPPGLELTIKDFAQDIRRRAPGEFGTTARREDDIPEILSGVYNGHTTGAPLTILFVNRDTESDDYELFGNTPRPGHADFTASSKFLGFNDPSGSGHFSGRLTLPLVAAGVVAKRVGSYGISARIVELGGIRREDLPEKALPDGSIQEKSTDAELWHDALAAAKADGDSLGAVVECTVSNMIPGLGEPFFDSVESLISHAIFSIPGVRGIEFGDGFRAAAMRGSQHNDPFVNIQNGWAQLAKNGAGGVNGGISNGEPLVFRVAFKPTSSIARPQTTYNKEEGKMTRLSIPGRHDVCFALRTPPIVEAVTAIVLADLTLLQ